MPIADDLLIVVFPVCPSHFEEERCSKFMVCALYDFPKLSCHLTPAAPDFQAQRDLVSDFFVKISRLLDQDFCVIGTILYSEIGISAVW
jgi:hypothetical protein